MSSPPPEAGSNPKLSPAANKWWSWCKQMYPGFILIVLVLVSFVIVRRLQTWRLVSKEGRTRTWESKGIIYIDTNGDGRIDEERRPGKMPGEFIVLKDSDFDGYYDLRYRQQTNGIATFPDQIKEAVPRR